MTGHIISTSGLYLKAALTIKTHTFVRSPQPGSARLDVMPLAIQAVCTNHSRSVSSNDGKLAASVTCLRMITTH